MADLKWIGLFALGLVPVADGAFAGGSPPEKVVASIDLSKPFATRSPWRLTATQGPEIADPTGMEGVVPGPILACLRKGGDQSCSSDLGKPLHVGRESDLFDEPHFLQTAQVVRPRGPSARALLLVQLASVQSADGDQRVATQLLAYDRARDGFVAVFTHVTGRNNNQEVRYIDKGPLRGAVVTAEPTENAPFGYWIAVNALTPAYGYRQTLRYRSATRYGDGNPLAAIDSEMPNIQQHLGLWRPGKPLPVPKGCAKPRLLKMELWC